MPNQALIVSGPAAPSDLVERLRSAANDAGLVRCLVESIDSASVAAAFVALLTIPSAGVMGDAEHRTKARNRPCPSLPAETFVEVVLFADRDTLDAVQLSCSFLLNFVRERELAQLALRLIAKVNIGRSIEHYEGRGHWLPLVEVVRGHGAGNGLVAKSVHHLTCCLLMAFCATVCINLIGAPETGPAHSDVCGMLFHDFAAPNTSVGTLTFVKLLWDAAVVARGIEAFKSVKTVSVEWDYEFAEPEHLDETFFVSAAQHGVRHIELKPASGSQVPADAAAALSFGFAEPTSGVDRCLLGVVCEIGSGFLAAVKQKVAEITENRRVDFSLKLANVSSHIDSTGFEEYQKDEGRAWLMDDLENRVNVEVKQTDNFVEIHVFSFV